MAPSGDSEERPQRRVLVVAFCVVPSATHDGASVLSTIRALNRRYAIDVVSVKSESLAHIERFHRARLLRVPLGTTSEADRMEAFRRAVRRQLEGESYDVVHVRGPLEGVPVCEMRELRGYKILYELGTFPSTEPGAAADSARRDEMYCLSTADVVLVASEASRAHLYQRGVGERVAVIPRGVDVDLFDWDFARPTQVATLMAIGPFPKSRDVGTMLQAIALVVRELPVRLRLVGETDPARAGALSDKVRTLDLAEWVEIAPAPELEDLPAAIGLCDAGIAGAAPVDRYLRAGDSVPGLLEFMACRRPVIAARIPAIRDVFVDRRELLFYEPGDPESLAEAILSLLRSTTRRESIAQAGYRRVRDEFPASASRRRLLSVYRTLADSSTDALRLGPLQAGTTQDREADGSEPARTPTPAGMPDLDTFIVAASRPERDDFTPPRDTSPGTPLSEVAIIESRGPGQMLGEPARGKDTDTDPEFRMQKERAAAPEPAVVVDPSLVESGVVPSVPATRGDEGQTGEIQLDELPRETTRSVIAAAVAPDPGAPESSEPDFADEPTRSVPLPRVPDRPDTDSMRPSPAAGGLVPPGQSGSPEPAMAVADGAAAAGPATAPASPATIAQGERRGTQTPAPMQAAELVTPTSPKRDPDGTPAGAHAPAPTVGPSTGATPRPLVPRPPSVPRLPAVSVRLAPPPPAPPPRRPVVPTALPPPPVPHDAPAPPAIAARPSAERSGPKPAPPPPVRPSSAPGARPEAASQGFVPEATARAPSASGAHVAGVDSGRAALPVPAADAALEAAPRGPRPTPPFPFFPLPPLDLGVDEPVPTDTPATPVGLAVAGDFAAPIGSTIVDEPVASARLDHTETLEPTPPRPIVSPVPAKSPDRERRPSQFPAVPIDERRRVGSGQFPAATLFSPEELRSLGGPGQGDAEAKGRAPSTAAPPIPPPSASDEPEVVAPPSLDRQNDTVPLTHEIVAPPADRGGTPKART